METVKFDVAENATRFVFDEEPVHDEGQPDYGNSFVTQGYIYLHGTLDGGNGMKPNGEPEFPDNVIGEWTCRGWFVGEGARTETGPWIVTNVHNNLDHPIGPLLYTISTMHCMTVSLAQDDKGLGAMWGEEKAREMLGEAGFTEVEVEQLPHGFQNNYFIARKS